jgi:hypothetical protein
MLKCQQVNAMQARLGIVHIEDCMTNNLIYLLDFPLCMLLNKTKNFTA